MTGILALVALAVVVALLVLGALWVSQSFLRMTGAVALLVLVVTHGTPPLWLCAILAAGLATLAVAIVRRALASFGGHLLMRMEVRS